MPRWNTVAIVGVGLIGGSIGLALRARGLGGPGDRRSGGEPNRFARRWRSGPSPKRRFRSDESFVRPIWSSSPRPSTALPRRFWKPSPTFLHERVDYRRRQHESRDDPPNWTRALPAKIRFVGGHPLAGGEKAGVGIRLRRFVRRPSGDCHADRSNAAARRARCHAISGSRFGLAQSSR